MISNFKLKCSPILVYVALLSTLSGEKSSSNKLDILDHFMMKFGLKRDFSPTSFQHTSDLHGLPYKASKGAI